MSLSLSGAPGSAAAVGAALNPLIQIRDLITKSQASFNPTTNSACWKTVVRSA